MRRAGSTHRRSRIGRRARQTGRLFWRDWAFVAEVAEFDPPRRVVYQVIEGYRVRTAIEVAAIDTASCRLTLTVTAPRLLGPLDGLVSRLLLRSTKRRGQGDLQRLAAALA